MITNKQTNKSVFDAPQVQEYLFSSIGSRFMSYTVFFGDLSFGSVYWFLCSLKQDFLKKQNNKGLVITGGFIFFPRIIHTSNYTWYLTHS